jgi:hypothetical protein
MFDRFVNVKQINPFQVKISNLKKEKRKDKKLQSSFLSFIIFHRITFIHEAE